jgi:hypothetical protein
VRETTKYTKHTKRIRTRNPKQIQIYGNSRIENDAAGSRGGNAAVCALVLSFAHLRFEFVSSFGLRV